MQKNNAAMQCILRAWMTTLRHACTVLETHNTRRFAMPVLAEPNGPR